MSLISFSNIQLPAAMIDIAGILSKANMPLSLILLGIYLNFTFDKQLTRPIMKYIFYRYTTGLIGGLILYFLLPVNEMFKLTILIGFLLPMGLSVIPYAHEFKYTTIRLIGTISNICIVISIVILYLIANFMV